MKQLDKNAVWLFFVEYVFVTVVVLLVLLFFSLLFLPQNIVGDFAPEILGLLLLLIPAVGFLNLILAKMSYEYYRYELTEDSFRKEHGIIWKKYVSIPYERIQNIDIHRGLTARLLGLSDLNIQTAGSSAQTSKYGSWGNSAEGRLPGLTQEVAFQLRDELMIKTKAKKNHHPGI